MSTAVTPSPVAQHWEYKTDRLCLVPYLANVDVGILPDDFLIKLYLRCKEEKLLEPVFAGFGPMTASRFMSYFFNNPLLVGMACGEDGVWKFTGFGWLPTIEGRDGARKASVAFLFFREYWGQEIIRQTARMAIGYWFKVHKIDVLFGATTKANVAAQRFQREFGFIKTAEIPKWFPTSAGLQDAVIVYQTREQFEALERGER